MHILNFILAGSDIFRTLAYCVMFHAYSGIFTKLPKSRHVCPRWGIFQQMQTFSGSWYYQFKYYKATPGLQVGFFF